MATGRYPFAQMSSLSCPSFVGTMKCASYLKSLHQICLFSLRTPRHRWRGFQMKDVYEAPSGSYPQGCSTLSTAVPLGQCIESGESSGVSLLVERCGLIAA